MVTAAGRTEETSDIAITYKEAKAMLEIKVTIEAKELAQSIEKLAEALKGSVVISPEGVQAQLSGVQASGIPTVIPASAIAESVPPVNTNAQQVVAQNAVDQIPAAQTAQVQPGQTAQAAQQQFMNPPVTAAAPVIDLETISRAGAALIDQGKTADVLALLKQFGVPAVNLLDPSQFPAFAEGLKALGASI